MTEPTDLPKLTNDESFQLSIFHPILIRFGLGADIGIKSTYNKFEMNKAILDEIWYMIAMYVCDSYSYFLTDQH